MSDPAVFQSEGCVKVDRLRSCHGAAGCMLAVARVIEADVVRPRWNPYSRMNGEAIAAR